MSSLVYYILCGVLTLGVLAGIAMMSKVRSAVRGNLLSAMCTAAAVILTLYKYDIVSGYGLWICMTVGFIAGLIGAYKVKMIQMPETVALLNGFGGAASALVAVIAVLDSGDMSIFSILTAGIALAIGAVTLTGSLAAAGKLHKLLPQTPIVWKNHKAIITISALLTAVSIAAIVIAPPGSVVLPVLVAVCAVLSAFFGIAFAVRVGGADMPITISLLNSLSGVAGAITGMAVSNPLLVAIGGVVGASGLLLTQIMCRAMNRSLADILLGKVSMPAKASASAAASIPVRESEIEKPIPVPTDAEDGLAVQETPQAKADVNLAQLLSSAKKVIIIPGYGMALSQAQGLVKQLADKLEARGTEVMFAIHPVAGRMPGHMNVLLCEVDVPYEKLYEMEVINPHFADCDAAIIIGANDVVNPAANTAEGTPIYGMPVLNADKAKHLIICNYDLKPGYAGVENPLYKRTEGVTLLLGDAKDGLQKLLEFC